jgi:hypothetical protein
MDSHKPARFDGSSPNIKLVHGSRTIAIMSSNISSNLGPLTTILRYYTRMRQ